MNHFYSSLVISNKKFPDVHQVFRPRYNKEFFKRLGANIEQLEQHVEKRCKNPKEILDNVHLKSLRDDAAKLVKLKDRLMSREKSSDGNADKSLTDLLNKLEAIEDRVMPLAVAIPNRYSKQVPTSDTVINQIDSSFAESANLTKVLNHTKLSYINNCYSKSVIGPNSHQYFGVGAKLQYALADFFTTEMETRDFVQTSGLCLAKSALVEAANSKDLKDYKIDPCRILTTNPQCTTLHLVEASREALVGFVSLLEPQVANTPLRLMASGAAYRDGSLWFDSDVKRVTQFQTLHALILTSSIEQHSMKEFHDTRDFIWDIYVKLGLPSRLVHCSLDNLISNEYDAFRIDIWLPSRQQWISVGRVSHYLDYITVRTGMKRGHILDAMVYDSQALVAAIIENRQTCTGRFIIPSAIKEHMVYLTGSESASFFREEKEVAINATNGINSNTSGVMSNYEQRRYLVRKSYAFGHSKKVERIHGNIDQKRLLWAFGAVVFFYIAVVDWDEFFIQFLPEGVKRFLYDRIYRPYRRFKWSLVYPKDIPKPEDLPWDKLDRSDHDLSPAERKKKIYNRSLPSE